LYEADPKDPGVPTRLFSRAGYATTRVLGGGLVQPRALKFAEAHHQVFSITGTGHDSGTLVGNFDDELSDLPGSVGRLQVALLGCGTVGAGVYERLTALPNLFEVVGVVNLDPKKALASGVDGRHLVQDAKHLIEKDCDVVIELIGGTEPARTFVEHALRLKRHVVTANKALMAATGIQLQELASDNGVTLRYSAAVGGALPALEAVALAQESDKTASIKGIINGTCNFICDQLESGVDFDDAVAKAQAAGFAEADPTLDLDGTDAAQKLVLLVRKAFGIDLPFSEIDRVGIDALSPAILRQANAAERTVRLIAECRRSGDSIRATVRPIELPVSHPFVQIRGAENCLLIETVSGRRTLLTGRGAGRYPTSESVLADLFDIRQEVRAEGVSR
jgi:homoserine dehydrogenase